MEWSVDGAIIFGMTKRGPYRNAGTTPPRRPLTFVRQWRQHRGMTIEQLADLAGMSNGNLSALERGAQGYTQDALEALAKPLKVNPGWLLEVNPEDEGAFLRLWDRAKPDQRTKIVAVARALLEG